MKIGENSHLDHGLSKEVMAHIEKLFGDRNSFFIETVELPEELGTVECGLHGPSVGDSPVPDTECTLEVRGTRGGPSRLCSRQTRQTRQLTVIAGPAGDEPCILYTAFGGPSAPREPWDSGLDEHRKVESAAFWAVHALSR
jgi:hypothetical protein